jgi:predicted amidohydrolase
MATKFEYTQAEEIRDIFARYGVRYLFIGKSGAILLGFPDTTQDADLFVEKTRVNGERLVQGLRELGFSINEAEADEIRRGKDFIQLKNGPFDLDLIFAPDGIESFQDAWEKHVDVEGFPVCHLDDIIASNDCDESCKGSRIFAAPCRVPDLLETTTRKSSVMRVAAIQLQSQDDVAANLVACQSKISEAAAQGAKFIVLPENFAYFGCGRGKRAIAESLAGPAGPIRNMLSRCAVQHGVTLLAGGWPELSDDPKRPFNAATVFAPDGTMLANYRKIHLFDVTLPSGSQLQESAAMTAGTRIVCCNVLGFRIGLSICYDVRFPELYRGLVDCGSEVLCVPSAFTAETGKDHWHVLLRTRAIESQCWVIAANQFGQHPNELSTYGHSLIIDPWGNICAEAKPGSGFILADIDWQSLQRVRTSLPCLRHRRLAF